MEYRTDYSFNVWRHNGEWVCVRPNADAPHCSADGAANAAAEYWAAQNRKRGPQ